MKRIAGVGFSSAATKFSFDNLFSQIADKATLTGIAVLSDKTNQEGFSLFVQHETLPLYVIDSNQLTRIKTPTQSYKSLDERGVGSVCEALALYVAGADAKIEVTRLISDDRQASMAIAYALNSVEGK